MTPIYQRTGKQVFCGVAHLCDAADDQAAEQIIAALNARGIDATATQVLALRTQIVSLRYALAQARDQFRDRAQQHRANVTANCDLDTLSATAAINRAQTNNRMAEMCQKAIVGSRSVVPSEKPKDA